MSAIPILPLHASGDLAVAWPAYLAGIGLHLLAFGAITAVVIWILRRGTSTTRPDPEPARPAIADTRQQIPTPPDTAVSAVVSTRDVPWDADSHGERYAYRRKPLAAAASGRELGCSLYRVPPGKRPFPYHYHTANEEAIYVLSGRGTLRTPIADLEFASGDYISLPVGEAAARQVINTGSEPLEYLCLSTMCDPEIVGYPDTGKVGLFAGSAPFGPLDARTRTMFLPEEAATDYWSGEQ